MADAPWTALATWIVLHALVGCAGTWWARRYALHHDLLDHPGERRSHDVPTPRGGGIAIVASMLLALLWLALRSPAHAPLLLATASGCALVAGIGWLDDHRPLLAWPRLLVQVAAAALLGWGLHGEGAGAGVVLVAMLGAMVLVNVWNFMDGIDAIAASQALLVAGAFAILAGSGIAVWFALAVAAGCLGFLPFNLPKARIFLGDVGSGALGYALAALSGWLLLHDWRDGPILLLPLSAFLLDASLTLASRVVRGARWWTPHAEHAYQHWARRRGHGAVTLAYAAWTVLASLLMLAVRTAPPAFIVGLGLVVGMAAAGGWASLRRVRRGSEDTKE